MATDTKIKKKIFVQILAPKLMREEVFGETPVTDPRSLLGKNMRINLMGITGDPKDQNIEVKLNINSLKGDSVGTELIGCSLLPAYIRKMVRKEKRRADDCFDMKTADNKPIRIKIFMLTIHMTSNSVLTSLRKKIRDLLKLDVEKLSFEALATEILNHKIQDKLRKDLAKIYPLKSCEIKSLEILKEDKKGSEELKVEEVKPEVVVVSEVKVEENASSSN